MSRHPTGDHNPEKLLLPVDIHNIAKVIMKPSLHIPLELIAGICMEDQQNHSDEMLTASIASSLNSIQTINWKDVQTATSSDNTMNLLLSIIEEGLPDQKHLLPTTLREFHPFRKHLYSVDGVIIYKDRIVIPPSLRVSCLTALHAAHQGTSSMIARAESSIFWPEITNDIHATIAKCNHCNRMVPSQAAMPPTQPILSA